MLPSQIMMKISLNSKELFGSLGGKPCLTVLHIALP